MQIKVNSDDVRALLLNTSAWVGTYRLWLALLLRMSQDGVRGKLVLTDADLEDLVRTSEIEGDILKALGSLPKVKVTQPVDRQGYEVRWKGFNAQGRPKVPGAEENWTPGEGPKALLQHYSQEYIRYFGGKPFIKWGQDTMQAKALLKQFTFKEACDFVSDFLSRPPVWCVQNRAYGFSIIPGQINRIIARRQEEKL